MNRKLIISIIITVVLLALVIPPYVLLLTATRSSEDTKMVELIESFRATYGYEAKQRH